MLNEVKIKATRLECQRESTRCRLVEVFDFAALPDGGRKENIYIRTPDAIGHNERESWDKISAFVFISRPRRSRKRAGKAISREGGGQTEASRGKGEKKFCEIISLFSAGDNCVYFSSTGGNSLPRSSLIACMKVS